MDGDRVVCEGWLVGSTLVVKIGSGRFRGLMWASPLLEAGVDDAALHEVALVQHIHPHLLRHVATDGACPTPAHSLS
jgi:hypothetical protein